MAPRTRRVVWSASARDALDDALRDIAKDSRDGAVRILTLALETGNSLSSLPERGRIVPEVGDSNVRELFVFAYRLIYRVHDDRVVIQAFLHGARDFSKWRRKQPSEL